MFTIIAGLQKKEILLLVKIKEQKDKIIGKDYTKKEKSFLTSDLVFTFPEVYSSENKALEALSNLQHFFQEKQKGFNLTEIYELLSEEYTEILFSDIEELLLNNTLDTDRLALKQFFLSNSIYFHLDLNKGILYISPPESIEKILKEQEAQQAKKAKEEQSKNDFLECIQSAITHGTLISYPDTIKTYIDILKDFAIFEDQSKYKSQAEKILQSLATIHPQIFIVKGNIYYEAFKALVFLGVFKENENLLLARYGIHENFSQEVEQKAQNIMDSIQNIDDRVDLREIFTFTIDGEDTQDFDDAMSVKKTDTGLELYIHIADVAHFIKPNTVLDKVAQERYRTLYLVDQNIFLLPVNLSKEVLALKEGKDSLALTYKISFSQSYELQNYTIIESIVHIDKNYSYTEIDNFLTKTSNKKLDFLPSLFELAQALQKNRIEKNEGIDILFPQISPSLKNDKLSLKIYDPQDNSAFIIKEIMILANSLSAFYVQEKNYPFIYFCQEAPTEEIKIENRYIKTKEEFNKLGKFMKKSYMTTQNIGHFALGISHYTQITSPIRRYIDILNQRQLKQSIKDLESLYTLEDLSDEIIYQEPKKSLGNSLENERNKYYLLKYLSYHKEKQLTGMVIKILSPTDFLVELSETRITCKVKSEQEKKVWEIVTVKIHTVYPRIGLALGNIV